MEIGIGKALRKIIEKVVNQRPAFLPGRVQRIGRGAKGSGELGRNRSRRAFRVGEEQASGVPRKIELGNDPKAPLRGRFPQAMERIKGQIALPTARLMKLRATPAFKGHALIIG